MNENLDLTKILKGCPIGTEFYHTGYGKVWFIDIYPDRPYPIIFRLGYNICNGAVTSAGTINKNYNGECVFFPSEEQRDWSKFIRFLDKPKVKKFDVHTLQPFDKVLVRDSILSEWTCTLFSHIINDVLFPIYCSGGYFKYCIPYNEETKPLVGTKEDCPEFYKWWEK